MERFSKVGIVTAVMTAIAAGPTTYGDIVVMHDGRRYEGEVVSETSGSVKLHTVAAGVECTLEFARHEVADIEKKPLPEGFFTDRPTTPAPSPPVEPKPQSNATPYLEVPLVGVFGKDFDETAIEEVMTFARLKEIRHLVFTIDSPGGRSEVADRIAELMKRNDDRFEYICRLRKSFSASLWVIVQCDRVFVDSSAATGAAVEYTRDIDTGEVAVDEKLLSARAAGLAARAADKGQVPPEMVRAMVLPEASVYVCKTKGGVTTVLDKEPAKGTFESVRCIDDGKTVLSLTAGEAVEYGFAQPWSSRDVAVGDGWRLYNQYGQAAIKRSGDRARMCQQVLSQVSELERLLQTAKDTQRADDFRDYRYEYYTYWDGVKYVSASRMQEASARLHADRDRRWQAAWTAVESEANDMLHAVDRIGKNPPSYVEAVAEAAATAKRIARGTR